MEATQDEIKRVFETLMVQNDGVYEKWLASAHVRLQNYHLHSCESAEDVVHTLYVKLMNGRRKWDKDKYPDFIIFFFMLIKSHIRNLAETEKEEVELDDPVEKFFGNNRSLLEQACEFKELCLKKLGDDERLRKVFCAFADGLANREVAKDLNLNIRIVQNTKKRIIRKLQPVYDQYYHPNPISPKIIDNHRRIINNVAS